MSEGECERRLIEAMGANDSAALSELYDRYAPQMMRLAVRILRHRTDAEDLVHDVFLEAWERIDEYDATRGSVRAWLVMRTRSRAIDRLRTLKVAREYGMLDIPESDAMTHDQPAEATDGNKARASLDALPDEQNRVIDLCYFQGMTCREVASEMGIPVGTVKSRLSAGLLKLRKMHDCRPLADQ